MTYKNFRFAAAFLFFALAIPLFCRAENATTTVFNFDQSCGATISGPATITCKNYQRGSQTSVETIEVATCICANTCLTMPPDHYYYDDPVAKTRQTDANAITLPVVLAWDPVEAWMNEAGEYVWSGLGLNGQETVTSKIFGARSYLLEIDNANHELNESQSDGEIFRQILKTTEFNPTDQFYPCFFNSGRTIKWRVRPCCGEDGSYCMPADKAQWWEFTTSYAPEPIIAKDPDWNGQNKAAGIPFKGYQIKWCRVPLPESGQFAKSYRLMVTSDEKGSNTLNCHPLMVSNGQCRDDDILSDSNEGEVRYITDHDNVVKNIFPVQGRQDHALFTRNRTYAWKMKTCFDDTAANCSDYGQTWKFSTKNDPIGIPEAVTPKNSVQDNDLAALPLSISWTITDGANSFVYQTSFLDGDQKTGWPIVPNNNSGAAEKLLFDADNLKPDTQYKWRAKACAKFDSTDCDGWSDWFVFRTTGRPAKAESMAQTGGIPAVFSWEAVPGAKSYNFSIGKTGADGTIKILNDSDLLKNPKHTLGYPDIDQSQNYTWKVQTCAHADGTVCGAWSQEKTFAAPTLTAAANVEPAMESTIYADQLSQNISWDAVTGASAYHYVLSLTASKEKQSCTQEPIEKTISRVSDTVQLNCLGEYQLTVQPCVDAACKSEGPKSESKFTLDQHVPANKSSFAVCGTAYDDPDTQWNEREACQPKHTLLLIKIAIDFALFKLSIWLLPILALATGLLFYSPFGTPDILEKVKTWWKYIGIGYALLVFAWIITGFILQIAGFPGLWFKIL
ncbi:MAG: pilin [Minisyncoccales bacterium]